MPRPRMLALRKHTAPERAYVKGKRRNCFKKKHKYTIPPFKPTHFASVLRFLSPTPLGGIKFSHPAQRGKAILHSLVQ